MFDFGIGSSELVIIAVVALIVIGPKDLPKVLRTIGHFTSKMRSMAREFQSHLEEATREAGLDDVKSEVNKMTNFTVTDMDKAGDDIKKAIEETSPKPASSGNGADAGPPEVAIEPAEKSAGDAGTGASAPQPPVAAKKRAAPKKTTTAKKAGTAKKKAATAQDAGKAAG